VRQTEQPVAKRTQPPLTVGVIADTHVPDRFNTLHPCLESALRQRRADLILHAGDISTPAVLERLNQIAPVNAVRGNRDWAFGSLLPWQRRITLGNTTILMLHGHGGLGTYFLDKFWYMLQGYRTERYFKVIDRCLGDEQVVVFGHTHRPLIQQRNGRLYFNPGSAALKSKYTEAPSLGFLTILPDGGVEAEIVNLPPVMPNCRTI
jgi:putative phosphoesterase